jgi:hypothetical protein
VKRTTVRLSHHHIAAGVAKFLRLAREDLDATRERLANAPDDDIRAALAMTLKSAEQALRGLSVHRRPDWRAASALVEATDRLNVASSGAWPHRETLALLFGAHCALGMAQLATHDAAMRSEHRSQPASRTAQFHAVADANPGMSAAAWNRMLPVPLDGSVARREARKRLKGKRVA